MSEISKERDKLRRRFHLNYWCQVSADELLPQLDLADRAEAAEAENAQIEAELAYFKKSFEAAEAERYRLAEEVRIYKNALSKVDAVFAERDKLQERVKKLAGYGAMTGQELADNIAEQIHKARDAAYAECEAIARKEAAAYFESAKRCDASGNTHGGTADTTGGLACERVANVIAAARREGT